MAANLSTPALFLAHGSPMLALEGGSWGQTLGAQGRALKGLRGVLVCSAHWETPGPFHLTSAPRPGILHDFSGFPDALCDLDYPALGSPLLAREAADLLLTAGLDAVLEPRPLDHGTWVPLRYLLPDAEVPVVQLSLPRPRTPALLLAAGRALAALRQTGVLIVGSGGIVHNLGRLDWAEASGPRPWAEAFDSWVRAELAAGHDLSDWRTAPGAAESVPTSEHLDPLFVALGAGGAPPEVLFDGWQLGSLSLASYRFA
ncbi:MAG: class III extradiol ring-cleavage dioxygenase [Acidobacteria bacterium]|nr:class III extradiol ring-cleavage dioxygenase [Acidobacteriota bacterium]